MGEPTRGPGMSRTLTEMGRGREPDEDIPAEELPRELWVESTAREVELSARITFDGGDGRIPTYQATRLREAIRAIAYWAEGKA